MKILVFKCNQISKSASYVTETARSTPSQEKKELVPNVPPARASNTSTFTISAVPSAEETEKTTHSQTKKESQPTVHYVKEKLI